MVEAARRHTATVILLHGHGGDSAEVRAVPNSRHSMARSTGLVKVTGQNRLGPI